MSLNAKLIRFPVQPLRDVGAGELGIYILPRAFKVLLLSVSERFLWDTTYLDLDGSKVILSDTEKSVVEAGIEGLTKMADINITVNSNCSNSCSGAASGCDWLNYCGDNPDVRNLPVYPPVDDDDTPGTTDPGVLSPADKCKLATYLVDSLTELYNDLDDYWQTAVLGLDSIYVWLTDKWTLAEANPSTLVPFSLLLLGQILAAFVAVRIQDLLASAYAAVVEFREQLICSITQNPTPSGARTRWYEVIATIKSTHGTAAYALIWAHSHLWSWNKLYAGEVTVPASYDGTICGDCGNNVPISGSPLVYDHDTLAPAYSYFLGMGELQNDGTTVHLAIWNSSVNNGGAKVSKGSVHQDMSGGNGSYRVDGLSFKYRCEGNNEDIIKLYLDGTNVWQRSGGGDSNGWQEVTISPSQFAPFDVTTDGDQEEFFSFTSARGSGIAHTTDIDDITITYESI